MNKSETIGKLAGALTAAQAEMPDVKKNAVNPFLKNKYADLGAVIETSRPYLAKNGLSISQFPTSDADKIGVTSILMHTSGEYIEDTIYISTSDSKGLSVAQSAGVVISYLRRYGWTSILGMYAEEDTDGGAAKPAPVGKSPQSKEPMTLEKAGVVRDAKGGLYSEKTVEELQHIIDTPAAPDDKKAAAKLLIEQKGK